MKQKGDELIVISKKMFFLILSGCVVLGVILGFSISFIASPKKEVEIKKIEDSEKTVLPSTVETALAKKQEPINLPSETNKNEAKANESKQKESNESEIKDKEIPQISADKEKLKESEREKLKEKEPQTSKTEKPNQIHETQSQIKTQDRIKSQNTEKMPSQTKKGKKISKSFSQNFYTVQLGAFSELTNAETLLERLKSNGYQVYLTREDNYKVRIGKYLKFSQAKKVSEELRSKGFENFILKRNFQRR